MASEASTCSSSGNASGADVQGKEENDDRFTLRRLMKGIDVWVVVRGEQDGGDASEAEPLDPRSAV